MTTPTPGQPLSEADVLPCTDCDGTGITTQTERACSCAAGDAYRPHAPVSRPGDGVEWPAVTNVWAETYCELTGKNPDGQQVTFVDGATVTTFRDMAKREIEAMLCAAPKAAVRAIAALTPPAEPVSRPAGEVTIRVGDDRIGPWRIWFGPPPIGTRNCDWHYQHEDDDGSCGWMSGSCGSRDECLEEIIIQYEERGS